MITATKALSATIRHSIYEAHIDIIIHTYRDTARSIDLQNLDTYQAIRAKCSIFECQRSRPEQIAGGKTYDFLKNLRFPGQDLETLLLLWQRWDMNDLNRGTRQQRKILQEARLLDSPLDKQIAVLKSRNLFRDGGYYYGQGWLVEPLPHHITQEFEHRVNSLK